MTGRMGMEYTRVDDGMTAKWRRLIGRMRKGRQGKISRSMFRFSLWSPEEEFQRRRSHRQPEISSRFSTESGHIPTPLRRKQTFPLGGLPGILIHGSKRARKVMSMQERQHETRKVVSHTNYWSEFLKKNEPSEFKGYISRDPILTKIFNFCEVPPIWKDIKGYPFAGKAEELKTISPEDEEHLVNLLFQDGLSEKQKEYLDYLCNLLQVVRATLWLKEGLEQRNLKEGKKFPDEKILERVEASFYRAISVDETVELQEENGHLTSIRRYGRFFPLRWVRVIETRDNPQGAAQTIYQEHYIFPPTGAQVTQALRELDKFSVTSYKRYNVDTFSASDQPEFLLGKKTGTKKFLVQLYYKNELLNDFLFRTQERYRPLASKQIEQITGRYATRVWEDRFRYTDILGTREDLFVDFDSRLKEKADRYDDKSPIYPAGYFKAALAHFANEVKEKYSSRTGDVPCDEDCRDKKEYMGYLPCEYDENGYCRDPKRAERIRTLVEYSGGSLQDLVPRDEDGEVERGETLADQEDPEHPNPWLVEQGLIEGIELARIYEKFHELRGIIEKEEDGEPLSDQERQIKHRIIEKVKEEYVLVKRSAQV
jgi:hypothetical protein